MGNITSLFKLFKRDDTIPDDIYNRKYVTVNHNFKQLVFEGGGAHGIGYAGALAALSDCNILPMIKSYAGTSIGSLFALCLILGYTADEITKETLTKDFNELRDSSFCFMISFKRRVSIYSGQGIEDWIKKLIRDKGFDESITFAELYRVTHKQLIVTCSCLSTATVEYMTHGNFPDIPVYLAVKASMSYPTAFKPVHISGHIYVDGGLGANYPITVYKNLDCSIPDTVIGLKLMDANEHEDNFIIHNLEDIDDNIVTFSKAIVTFMSIMIERSYLTPYYWDRTIRINSGPFSVLDFDIAVKDRIKSMTMAYNAVINDLEYFNKANKFSGNTFML